MGSAESLDHSALKDKLFAKCEDMRNMNNRYNLYEQGNLILAEVSYLVERKTAATRFGTYAMIYAQNVTYIFQQYLCNVRPYEPVRGNSALVVAALDTFMKRHYTAKC